MRRSGLVRPGADRRGSLCGRWRPLVDQRGAGWPGPVSISIWWWSARRWAEPGPAGRVRWRQAARAQLAMEAEVLRRRGLPVVAFQPTAEDQAVMGPDAMDAGRRAAVVRQVRASTRARLRRPDVAGRLAPLTPSHRSGPSGE